MRLSRTLFGIFAVGSAAVGGRVTSAEAEPRTVLPAVEDLPPACWTGPLGGGPGPMFFDDPWRCVNLPQENFPETICISDYSEIRNVNRVIAMSCFMEAQLSSALETAVVSESEGEFEATCSYYRGIYSENGYRLGPSRNLERVIAFLVEQRPDVSGNMEFLALIEQAMGNYLAYNRIRPTYNGGIREPQTFAELYAECTRGTWGSTKVVAHNAFELVLPGLRAKSSAPSP